MTTEARTRDESARDESARDESARDESDRDESERDRDERDAADSPRAYLGRLEGLAEAVTRQGLKARLVTPPGRVPSLHVVNPDASALAEDVYAGPCQDGQWWFWWSWAERIAAGDDLAGAASRISRVLAARD